MSCVFSLKAQCQGAGVLHKINQHQLYIENNNIQAVLKTDLTYTTGINFLLLSKLFTSQDTFFFHIFPKYVEKQKKKNWDVNNLVNSCFAKV